MTKPERNDVQGMTGRELDSAVHEFVIGRVAGCGVNSVWNGDIPCYSTERGAPFFAMLDKLREAGWHPVICDSASNDNRMWFVTLHDKGFASSVETVADTLPLALARAALLTTYFSRRTWRKRDDLIELAACQSVLLSEIECKEITQKSLAMTYAMAMCSSENGNKLIDWSAVNNAIIARWSRAGLERVKKLAWKLITDRAGAS